MRKSKTREGTRAGLLVLSVLGCGLGCGLGRGQAQCFRTAAEAAAGSGQAAADGFRLERTLDDPIHATQWAQVVQCGHSGWPALLVQVPTLARAHAQDRVQAHAQDASQAHARDLAQTRTAEAGEAAAGLNTSVRNTLSAKASAVPMVRAGERVTVIERSALVRLEVGGIAQANAGAGDQVRVRVGEERLLAGTVRSDGVVEIE